MIDIVLDNYIRVSGLPKDVFDEIIARLTYPNPAFINAMKYSDSGKVGFIPRTVRSYDYDRQSGQLLLPRGYYYEFLGLVGERKLAYHITDQRNNECIKNIKPQAKPRSYQHKMIEEAALYAGPSYLIQAPPGTGKTFTGLEFCRKRGRKVLWICHTEPLMKQAIEAAQWVLGLDKKEIGIIGRGKFQVGDFFTVATVQTLSRRASKLQDLKYEFGTIVVDEVHHAPANTWKQTINMFAPAETIGLTATAYRNDGLTQMLQDCMGPVVTKADKTLLQQEGVLIVPDVYMLYTNLPYQGKSHGSLITKLIEDERRNQIILKVIRKLYEVPTNVVMVLTERRDHVVTLYDLCVQEGMEPLKMLGGMTKMEKTLAYETLDARKSRLIIATYELISEGFDYPPINYVMLATPFKNPVRFEQSAGRAQRVSDNKDSAAIVDFIDNNGIFRRQAMFRAACAEGLGYDVRYYNSNAL